MNVSDKLLSGKRMLDKVSRIGVSRSRKACKMTISFPVRPFREGPTNHSQIQGIETFAFSNATSYGFNCSDQNSPR